MRRSMPSLLVVLVAMLVAACRPATTGGFVVATDAPGSPGASAQASQSLIPVIISTQLVVGDNRLVFSFIDAATQQPVGSPDLAASVSFTGPGATTPTAPVQGEFIWAIQGLRGEYITHATFPAAGDWRAVFDVQPKGAAAQSIGVTFTVLAKGTVVKVGDKAPDTKTPTLADAGGNVRKISTDQNPVPAFYQVSVDQALAQHTPFVLIFATPAFCKSAQCGPTLDMVKQAQRTAPSSVAFIHVEPYVLTYTDGRLQPVLDAQGNLQPNAAANAWGLPTEPWVFAVDRNGVVQGSFEGVVSQQELADVISKIAGS